MTSLRVGSIISLENNVCEDPDSCPVCSGHWNDLSPMQQHFALAKMKHLPHLQQLRCVWNYPPFTPDQLEWIKERYQRTSNKPVRQVLRKESLDWDDYATEGELKQLDENVKDYKVCQKMTEEYNKKPQAMLIDVGEQSEKDVGEQSEKDVGEQSEKDMNNYEYEAASALLSMGGKKKE